MQGTLETQEKVAILEKELQDQIPEQGMTNAQEMMTKIFETVKEVEDKSE